MNADQLRSLQPALAALLESFRPCFQKEPTFRHLETYVLGLLADLKRKSVEPIALAAGVSGAHAAGVSLAARLGPPARPGHAATPGDGPPRVRNGIGVIDASAHAKQGKKTPGVQRQWCGETGKVDNCVVGQHLLYTDNDPTTRSVACWPATCICPGVGPTIGRVARRRHSHEVTYRPKWQIAIDQVAEAVGNGVRFSWLTFDEDYGSVPQFWFELDRWVSAASARCGRTSWSGRACRTAIPRRRRTRPSGWTTCAAQPGFREQGWYRLKVKDTTRGPAVWELKASRVHLVDTRDGSSRPTDRQYWLIVPATSKTGKYKYFVSNAAGGANWKQMMRATFARWHVEKWFERAKQEAGFGAFEVRRYTGLMRHWFCATLAMYFLAAQTQRLRGEKRTDHAGAGGRRRQWPGAEGVEPLVALVG
jgi:SRSO17 transposase